MLSRLPKLFSPLYVLPAFALEGTLAIALRQLKLVKAVSLGSLVLCAMSFSPALSGPGPVLSWAASRWPSVFGAVTALLSQPLSAHDVVGGLVLMLLLAAVCLRELWLLRSFVLDLDVLDPPAAARDALTRLEATSPQVARYVHAVTACRSLRWGDCRVARAIAERQDLPQG